MATIEFPASARMVFRMGNGRLIVNPRECKGDARKLVWPHCSGPITKPDHDCKEMIHGPDSSVPVSRVIDNQYGGTDYASPWFAFWEADCMSPAISIVRAESWEAAYEDFLDTLPDADPSDWSDEEKATAEDPDNGNLPSGYSFSGNGRIIFTENVNGCEITLIEVTNE